MTNNTTENIKLDVLMTKLGHQFKNKQLLCQALTHRSASSTNNERLEFLGDALLSYVIATALYTKLDSANEGQLTRLRSNQVCRDTLVEIADELDLGPLLILGPGEVNTKHSRNSMKADSVEAIIGAVEQDAGFAKAIEVVQKLYQTRIENQSITAVIKDPKTQLQEYQQAKASPLPKYETVSIQGSSHDQMFMVSCTLPDTGLSAQSEGRSRRRAEQAAAAKVLKELGVSQNGS